MKNKARWPVCVALVVGGLLLGAQAVLGQQRPVNVTFRDVKVNFVASPPYRASAGITARRTQDWLQIHVEYETAGARGGWLDELTLNWVVAITPKTARPILLRTAVTYVDVADGRHNAVVYIRPGFLARHYGESKVNSNDMSIYIEPVALGVRMEPFNQAGRNTPRNWFEFREPTVTVRENELLNREQTPFGPLEYDAYEHIKPAGK